MGVLVFFQRPAGEDPEKAKEAAAGLGEIKAPKTSEFVMVGKLLLGVKQIMGMGPSPIPGEDPTTTLVGFTDQMAGWEGKSKFSPASVRNPVQRPKKGRFPEPAADRLRATVIAGEVMGVEELRWRVEDIEKDLDPKSALVEDVKVVRRIYGLGDAPKVEEGVKATEVRPAPVDEEEPDSIGMRDVMVAPDPGATKEDGAASQVAVAELSAEQKQGLMARHGWIGELALSRGAKDSTLREEAGSRGLAVLLLLGMFAIVVMVAGMVGFVLLILAAVRVFSGKWRWGLRRPMAQTEWPVGEPPPITAALTEAPPSRPTSIWLETVVVFLALFLGVKLVSLALEGAGASEEWLVAGTLGAQWLIAVSIFWPIVRGMSWARWRADVGWHKGRGVAREIGAGIMGYFAGLPVYFGMAIVVVIITLIWSAITGSESRPQGNKITELVEGGGLGMMIVIYLLATVWAPVVEETVFRGCLFRHIRRRTGLVLAALGSALAFAVLHGYAVNGLIMVGTLGVWFALMREWRGSIIASVTAHALHNGVVMALVITVLSLAG